MKKFFASKTGKFVVLPLLVIFIGIQFIPVERTNPPVVYKPMWDSPKTEQFARRACFDCHSNETKWPWYSYVAPISFLVAKDVKDGRKNLNFSKPDLGDVDDLVHEIEEGEMPLKPYLIMHMDAKLTDQEKKEFISGLKATFQAEELREDTEAAENEK